MADVYSTLFFRSNLNTVGPVKGTYTVPVGKRAVIKDIELVSENAGGLVAILSRPASSPIWARSLPTGSSSAAPSGTSWFGMIVFNAGETFEVSARTGNGVCVVSGYLLNSS